MYILWIRLGASEFLEGVKSKIIAFEVIGVWLWWKIFWTITEKSGHASIENQVLPVNVHECHIDKSEKISLGVNRQFFDRIRQCYM